MPFLPFIVLTIFSKSMVGGQTVDPNFTISTSWPYDKEIKLVRLSDKTMVYCYIPPSIMQKITLEKHKQLVELYNNDTGKILASAELEEIRFTDGHEEAKFFFAYNDTKIFGPLKCRLNGVSTSNTINISFQLCPDQGLACQNSSKECTINNADMKFCLYTKGGVHPCSHIEESWCDISTLSLIHKPNRERICPANKTSLCKAIAVDHKKIWYRTRHRYKGTECPQISEPPLSYKSKPVYYGQPIVIDQSETFLLLKCPTDSPFYEKEVSFYIFGPAPEIKPNPCRQNVTILFNKDAFTSGAQEVELTLEIGKYEFKIVIRLIFFGAELNISDRDIGSWYTERNEVYCIFTFPGPYADWNSVPMSEEFRVTKWLTKKSNGTIKVDEGKQLKFLKGWYALINESDEYQCHAVIEYKSCSPHRIYTHELQSKFMFRQHSPDPTTRSPRGAYLQGDYLLWIILIIVCKKNL